MAILSSLTQRPKNVIIKPKPRCQSRRGIYESPRPQFLKFRCLFSKKITLPHEMRPFCDVICEFHTYYYMFFHPQWVHIPSRTYRCNYPDCCRTLGYTFPDQRIRLDLQFNRKKLLLKYFVRKWTVYLLDLPCKNHICIVQKFIQNLTIDFNWHFFHSRCTFFKRLENR